MDFRPVNHSLVFELRGPSFSPADNRPSHIDLSSHHVIPGINEFILQPDIFLELIDGIFNPLDIDPVDPFTQFPDIVRKGR